MGGLDYGDYVEIAIVIHSPSFTCKRHGAKDNPRFLDPAESTSYLPGLHREPKKVGAKFFICGFRGAILLSDLRCCLKRGHLPNHSGF